MEAILQRKIHLSSVGRHRLDHYELEVGDLIISSRGNWIKVSVITEEVINIAAEHQVNLVISSNFHKVRFKELDANKRLIKAKFLRFYFTTAIGRYFIQRFMRGETLPILSHRDLEKIKIPQVSIEKQTELVDLFTKYQDEYYENLEKLEHGFDLARLKTFQVIGIDDDIIIKK
jgi:type I restriction enzyme M protein